MHSNFLFRRGYEHNFIMFDELNFFLGGLHWLHMLWEVQTQGFIGSKDHFQNYTRSYIRQNKKIKIKKKPWMKASIPLKIINSFLGLVSPFLIHSIWGQVTNSKPSCKKDKMLKNKNRFEKMKIERWCWKMK